MYFFFFPATSIGLNVLSSPCFLWIFPHACVHVPPCLFSVFHQYAFPDSDASAAEIQAFETCLRLEAILTWLKNNCAETVMEQHQGKCSLESVFHLLSAGQVEEAVEAALAGRNFRLAIVLSSVQAGSLSCDLLKEFKVRACVWDHVPSPSFSLPHVRDSILTTYCCFEVCVCVCAISLMVCVCVCTNSWWIPLRTNG